ncbi:MAG: epoxyqueuosine reductase QueH [Christensenellales bacterium]
MNKIDYNKLMNDEIKNLNSKPTLLLHSCCAPCSTSVLERLKEHFDITIFFYNPNIDLEEEFLKRQNEEIRLINKLNCLDQSNKIKIITCSHLQNEYESVVKGFEHEKEGGARCDKCFNLRLRKTAEQAKDKGFDYFSTTLSVSPHKNSQKLNEIGLSISKEFGIKFLVADFKKQDGFKRSIELSKKYNLYRQDYCGCKFSKNAKFDE